ncbi:MAG: NADPH:quinone reductase [Xanthobacteraceae bacterium]
MKAAFYDELGPAREVLRVADLPTPQPGSGEVRVRLRTSGVNPSDVKARGGRVRRGLSFPRVVPHSDGAGEIDAVGEGVPRSRIGERVWVLNGQWLRPFGTAAQFIALPSDLAIPLSADIDFAAGACFGIPLMTALRALTIDGPVEGQTVLIAGGAGAVGNYAVQIAKLKGAQVVATVSSDEKAKLARAAGADHCINYKRDDLGAAVKDITRGTGVDRVIEVNLSANASTIPAVLKKLGTVVVYGSDEPVAPVPATFGIVNSITFRFFIIYDVPAEWRHGATQELNKILASGRLIHTIAARFPLERIIEAHEAVESGRMVGNVVVDIS